MGKPNFFLVAVPIGNLKDITLRALEILKKADLILAEKPRKTLKLLNFYQIKKPVFPFFPGKNEKYLAEAIKKAKEGKTVAFVPEAGAPNLSDPGAKIVQKLIKEKIDYSVIPGASALTCALAVMPWSGKNFYFLGFLPKRKVKKALERAKTADLIIFFESAHRIKKSLKKIKELLGNKEILIARELTKKFEEVLIGKISQILPKIKAKGEFVVIVKQ